MLSEMNAEIELLLFFELFSRAISDLVDTRFV